MQKSSVLTCIFKNCSPEVKKTAFDFHSVEQLLPAAAAASSRSAIWLKKRRQIRFQQEKKRKKETSQFIPCIPLCIIFICDLSETGNGLPMWIWNSPASIFPFFPFSPTAGTQSTAKKILKWLLHLCEPAQPTRAQRNCQYPPAGTVTGISRLQPSI